MSFKDKYPKRKTPQEEQMEIRIRIVALIKKALEKTSETRSEDKSELKLTKGQIDKITEEVRKSSLRFKNDGITSLSGILSNVLNTSEDPEILQILQISQEIYERKQQEFEKSEEYKFMQQSCNNVSKRLLLKLVKAFDIGIIEGDKEGNIKSMKCRCNEAEFISPEFDNAVVKLNNGRIQTIIMEQEPKKSDKTK